MRALVTGGCGFLGHHLVEHLIKNTDWDVVVIDALTYASHGLSRLKDSEIYPSDRISIFTADLSHPLTPGIISEMGRVDFIFHLAAETHVDNSIDDPRHCIRNNVMSTLEILEYARKLHVWGQLKKMVLMSTDETYGPAEPSSSFVETDRHYPSNPYSASKSASEKIAKAYVTTYNLPLVIVNGMNIFGERQHVEKFLPKCVQYVMEQKELPIHTDQKDQPGSRFYIHARNVSDALVYVAQHGVVGEAYHIEGEQEVDNLELAEHVAAILERKLQCRLEGQPETRPGHDVRYALNGDKLRQLGWNCPKTFLQSLRSTVLWMKNNPKWLNQEVVI